MDRLKIGYFGGGNWSDLVINRFVDNNAIKICFIVPRNDVDDQLLKNISIAYNIPYLKTKDINDQLFADKLKTYNCDLFTSVGFADIFKENMFNIPQKGTINCHPGKLPFYRGRCALNWAIINDEKEFGITVHYIDKGIDTGDIILQKTFDIKDTDNYSSILKKARIEFANIYCDAIDYFLSNTTNRTPQTNIHETGMYCLLRKNGDEFIDWNWGSRRVFNFIRAINKPHAPGARTRLKRDGSIIIINSSKIIDKAPSYIGINGGVLLCNEGCLYIKTGDGVLMIDDYLSNTKIKVGDRFTY